MDMREKLAELSHEQWSGWIKYMFNECRKTPRGTLTIPPWAVDRWLRQANTSYKDLSEKEKESDRTEADKTLSLIKEQSMLGEIQ